MNFTLPPWTYFLVALGGLALLAVVGKVPLRYNLRNLLVRWWLTALCALIFVVVVGLLIVLLAFVNGMEKLAEGSGVPGNVMVLADGATDELFSNLGYKDTSNIEREVAAKDEDDQPLPAPVGVATIERDGEPIALCSREVYVIVNQPIPGQSRRRFVQLRGIVDPQVAGAVHNLTLAPGGFWFSDSGVRPLPGKPDENATEAVLGQSVAKVFGADVGKPSLEVGDTFEMGDAQWVVAGILQSGGSTFDSEIWARHQIVSERFRKQSYTSIVIRAEPGTDDDARTFAKHLTKNFRPAVQASVETEYYSKLSSTNEQFLWAIRFLAVLMAVGGVCVTMIAMFFAVIMRAKDIGVLRIIGYGRWQILVSFLLEALAIAVVGGIAGCALGSLADGAQATSILSSGQGGGKTVVLKLIVDANILGVGMLFALFMGGLGGLLPAYFATRLKLLDTLR